MVGKTSGRLVLYGFQVSVTCLVTFPGLFGRKRFPGNPDFQDRSQANLSGKMLRMTMASFQGFGRTSILFDNPMMYHIFVFLFFVSL